MMVLSNIMKKKVDVKTLNDYRLESVLLSNNNFINRREDFLSRFSFGV